MNPVRSEKGIALIVVLLLLGVMAALTSGLSLTSPTDVNMASDERFYAGARAAAEAGLNRAIEKIVDPANNGVDLLATGVIPGGLGNGPHDFGDQYQYSFEILDDDDPSLYPMLELGLSAEQLAAMEEPGNDPTEDENDYLIVRATGTGPKGTSVTLSRILHSMEHENITITEETPFSDPALLVNGDLTMNGSNGIIGLEGNVHANGNINANGGSGTITGDFHASGTIDPGGLAIGGTVGGGYPTITVPNVNAADYYSLSTWVLEADGDKSSRDPATGALTACSGKTCTIDGWNYSGGSWSWSGGTQPPNGTYYVQGSVSVKGTGTPGQGSVSIISEGNITLTGNGNFAPGNSSGIQFVANGDMSMGVDANDENSVAGQILIREQFKMHGKGQFEGRVTVQNKDSATNGCTTTFVDCRRGDNDISANTLNGGITITYDGGLGMIEGEPVEIINDAPNTFTNNFWGWLEQ